MAIRTWRDGVRSIAAAAISERARCLQSLVDEHGVARAVAYQDMSARLIRLIDDMDRRTPAPTEAPTDDLPVGTPVLAFPGARWSRALVTRTRSEVWTLSGIAVVSVEGHAGGVALSHIEVLP